MLQFFDSSLSNLLCLRSLLLFFTQNFITILYSLYPLIIHLLFWIFMDTVSSSETSSTSSSSGSGSGGAYSADNLAALRQQQQFSVSTAEVRTYVIHFSLFPSHFIPHYSHPYLPSLPFSFFYSYSMMWMFCASILIIFHILRKMVKTAD